MDKKWTKEELEEQKEEVLSEFNFHKVLDFCDILFESDNFKKYIKYESVAELRQEAKEIIDSFIKSYLESDICSSYYNDKWEVCMSGAYDGETPLLSLAFKYQVEETDAWIFCKKRNAKK